MVIVPVVYLPGITLIEVLKTVPYRTQQHGHVHVRIRFQILDLYGYALRIDGSLLLIALLARLYSGEVQPRSVTLPVSISSRLTAIATM